MKAASFADRLCPRDVAMLQQQQQGSRCWMDNKSTRKQHRVRSSSRFRGDGDAVERSRRRSHLARDGAENT
jgi:hypothetical protein